MTHQIGDRREGATQLLLHPPQITHPAGKGSSHPAAVRKGTGLLESSLPLSLLLALSISLEALSHVSLNFENIVVEYIYIRKSPLQPFKIF